MKINVYYGGRGIIEDPTLFVVNKLIEVLEELRVEVERFNLYEEKNTISMLPQTLKDADGVILATTVEWLGIGGYMQQFLDACWFYADKEKMEKLYMLPVVLSTTYGERDAENTLIKSWEMLGGKIQPGLCAYVKDHVEFETNSENVKHIEKYAEDLYRAVNKKVKVFPNSQIAMKQNVLRNISLELTPQESEQLSMYVSDDTYIKKQKEDIQELTELFKGMLSDVKPSDTEFVNEFEAAYKPLEGFKAVYSIFMQDTDKNLLIEADNAKISVYYGETEDADVIARTTRDVVQKIITAQVSFQNAFMTGEIAAKGNFKILRNFDSIFEF
ncbi:MAG: SCP2 sterol-binding domain-containing protein [bacterium]|nr:SCP2 sterol-binding domain-containing protein [bacterium]